MCSSAVSSSRSRTRWDGSGGRLDRRPEGAARYPACGGLPGAGGVPSWSCEHKDETVTPRAALAAESMPSVS